eukprot:scaffold9.g3256.t1
MEVAAARLGGRDGPAAAAIRLNASADRLELEWGEALGGGGAAVHLEFKYALKEGLAGFYRRAPVGAEGSTYKLTPDGETRSLAVTQFEANAARTAFPCFDEPAFKAVYNFKMEAPEQLQVLFNTQPTKHEGEEGRRSWHFAPTPPISTYLVAFVVGDLARVGRPVECAGGAVNVSVWGTPDRRVDAFNLLDATAGGGAPPLEADVRSAVYQTAVRHAQDAEAYEQASHPAVRGMYESARDADEKERLLVALGYASQARGAASAGRITETLDYAVGPAVRAQDARMLVLTVARWAGGASAHAGGPWSSAAQAWDWLKLNYDALHAKLGGGNDASRLMGQVVEGVASLFANATWAGEVDAMVAAHQGKIAAGGFAERAKESIAANARWVERHATQVCEWVAAQAGGGGGRRRR